jgi:tetratricopeptide (TPR) repeat protein
VLTITDRGLELARRVGDRYSEAIFLAGHVSPLVMLGRWDEAQARAGEAEELATTSFVESILLEAVGIHGERGALEQARQLLTRLTAVAQSEETEAVAGYAITEARLLRAEGRPSEALAAAERALVLCAEIGATSGSRKLALVEALEAAAALDDTDTVRQLLATLDQLRPGELTPFLKAQRARFRARLTEHEADTEFSTAEELFREHDTPFYLAVTQLEHAERLAAHGRADQAEPLLTQAREIFQRLQAKPWLDRLAAAQTQQPTQARA